MSYKIVSSFNIYNLHDVILTVKCGNSLIFHLQSDVSRLPEEVSLSS